MMDHYSRAVKHWDKEFAYFMEEARALEPRKDALMRSGMPEDQAEIERLAERIRCYKARAQDASEQRQKVDRAYSF